MINIFATQADSIAPSKNNPTNATLAARAGLAVAPKCNFANSNKPTAPMPTAAIAPV